MVKNQIFGIVLCAVLHLCVAEYVSGTKYNTTSDTGGEHDIGNMTEVHVSDFPEDIFTVEQKNQGAIILHCILAVYCFLTIAIVCTNYFMPTIERFCQVLNISDDVAAATFMSIATSSPELFSNIIGTFVTNSDIGVGHVIGNAYYDMFFVAFLGGVAASKNILLDWWPIARDCAIYLVVAATLTWVVWDGEVDIVETLVLLALYVLYFVIMFSNRAIIRFLQNKFRIKIVDPVSEKQKQLQQLGTELKRLNNGLGCEKDTEEHFYTIVSKGEKEDEISPAPLQQDDGFQVGGRMEQEMTERKAKRIFKKIGSLLLLPLNIATAMTIPDVKKPKLRNLYPISFVICICWIGVSTYLCTWMISTIGETIGVPGIIMGMVFMAAGGSVVEAYGVFYKTRRGECSIGFSNSMGCNTLDATMCLALPWLVKIMIYKGTGSPNIMLESDVLHVNCILLILSVVVMFSILYVSRFTLNWKMGVCNGVAYVAVLAIAITVELSQTSSHS